MTVLRFVYIVVGQLGNGGLERQVSILIPALLDRGVNVKCVVWNYSPDDAYSTILSNLLGNSLIGFSSKEGSFTKLINLRRLVKKEKPDLTLSFTTFLNAAVYFASFGQSKSVGSLRTSANLYKSTGGVKALINLRYPPRVLVNSKRAIKELDIFSPRIQVAYLANVIETAKFRPLDQKALMGQSLSIGNVRQVKRLDRLLDLLLYLKKKGHDPKHTHVGGGSGLEELRKKASTMGLNRHITFVGPSSNITDYLHSHSVFLHFAEYEGSPNVIMEAMAAGLPIITTDCGDASEYVQQEINGFVVHPFTVKEYSDCLIKLSSNQELWESMSTKSLELINNSDTSHIGDIFLKSLNVLNLNFQYPD